MNTVVSFEIAKLLKEKDWNKPTLNFYFEDGESKENVFKDIVGMDYGSEFTTEFSELIENWNGKWLTKKNGDRCFGCSKSQGYFETFSAPTIADVVMWLYEKHSIWINPIPRLSSWIFTIQEIKTSNNSSLIDIDFYESNDYLKSKGVPIIMKSPTEAYEAAIEYTLKNLV